MNDELKDPIENSMTSMDDVSRIEPLPGPKKIEFSKVIILMVLFCTLGVIVFSMFFMWHTGDTSPLGYLITGMFAQAAAACSVYYVKAKRENEIKLRALYGQYVVDEANMAVEQEEYKTKESFRDYI